MPLEQLTLSDEQVQDIVASLITSGNNTDAVYDDVNDTLTVSLSNSISVGALEATDSINTANISQASDGQALTKAASGTDLTFSSVSGKFESALSNGDVLADDGNLYNTIQDAENNATNILFIPPNTFNESVTVTTSGIKIVGLGDKPTIDPPDKNSVGQTALTLDASNITVENIHFSCESNADGVVDTTSNTSNAKIIECEFSGGSPTANNINGLSLIKDCEFTASTGKVAIQNASQVEITGCEFASDNFVEAFVLDDCDDISIRSCRFNTVSYAIDLIGATSHVDIENSHVTAADQVIQALGTGKRVNINNCYITTTDSNKKGIQISIPNSSVTNCLIEDMTNTSIEIGSTQGCVIESCHILRSENSGIELTGGGGGDHVINSCYIYDSQYDGIAADANDTIISDNRVLQSGSDSIDVGGTDVVVANNRIGNLDDADASSSTIINNEIAGDN